MVSQDAYRIVVAGVGAQGAGIVDQVCDLGHELVGAVDIGDKVGRPVSDYTRSSQAPAIAIGGTLTDVLDALAQPPHIVVLAAAVDVPQLLAMAGETLDRGINVITLHPDVFSRDDSWAAALHERAVAGGASFMSTGVQDTWWVQIPSLVASSSLSVHTIRMVSVLSLAQLSAFIGEEVGVGAAPEAFGPYAEAMMKNPATLGEPLREAARRMGSTAFDVTREIEPVVADEDYDWPAGSRTVPAGRVAGIRETFAFDTDRGIRFEGVIEIQPIAEEDTADELHVLGVPEHHLRYSPFPGYHITNVALVARIPDVVNAAPGVLFSADMPPASHQFPRA